MRHTLYTLDYLGCILSRQFYYPVSVDLNSQRDSCVDSSQRLSQWSSTVQLVASFALIVNLSNAKKRNEKMITSYIIPRKSIKIALAYMGCMYGELKVKNLKSDGKILISRYEGNNGIIYRVPMH